MDKFGVYVNGCFHITFENGVTVSTTIGIGTYSGNKTKQGNYAYLKYQHEITSNSAEIAIWDKNGDYLTDKWSKENGHDVAGWQSPKKLLSALDWASKYQP